MTKFEEELFNKVKVTNIELTTEAEYKKSTLINHFKNWHSDEEFQQLLEENAEFTRENNIVNKINSKLAKENEDLKSQLQQQALPVVPECVADYISELKEKGFGIKFGLMCSTYDAAGEGNAKAIHWKDDNAEDFARAWLDGYEVEKPQLFYIALPKVYGLSDSTFVSKAESGIISEFTKGKDYALKLTEQEIKSIDERYWQFAVPVEDGE